MGSIILWLMAKLGVGDGAARAIAYVGLAALLLGGFGVGKCTYDRSVIARHEAAIARRAQPATDQAAAERAKDSINNAKRDQERHDVINAAPDQPIAPTSRALACKRLRDAGRDPPACRRP